jgi:hypothetical protein
MVAMWGGMLPLFNGMPMGMPPPPQQMQHGAGARSGKMRS